MLSVLHVKFLVVRISKAAAVRGHNTFIEGAQLVILNSGAFTNKTAQWIKMTCQG